MYFLLSSVFNKILHPASTSVSSVYSVVNPNF